MLDHSQNQFIKNWNKTANLLSKNPLYKNCVKLNDSFFTGGHCCGFSFVLAEHLRLDREEEFYRIYYDICDSDPQTLANKIMHNSKYSIWMDFVMKVFILQNLQNQFTYENTPSTHAEKFAQEQCSAGNHNRIGNLLKEPDVDFGLMEKEDFAKLPNLLDDLSENESYEIGLYDETGGAHSILVYKSQNQFHLFDVSTGKKVSADNAKEAASNIMYASNNFLTEGTFKYTRLDALWKNSLTFKILGLTVFLPILFVWGLYDVFIAKPLSDEQLKAGPISDVFWMSWGKIKGSSDLSPKNDALPVNESSVGNNSHNENNHLDKSNSCKACHEFKERFLHELSTQKDDAEHEEDLHSGLDSGV